MARLSGTRLASGPMLSVQEANGRLIMVADAKTIAWFCWVIAPSFANL
jgi:hypothetical protein